MPRKNIMNNNTISLNANQLISLRFLMFSEGHGAFSIRSSSMHRINEIPLGLVRKQADILAILDRFKKMGHTHVYVRHVHFDGDWIKHPTENFQLSWLNNPTLIEASSGTI